MPSDAAGALLATAAAIAEEKNDTSDKPPSVNLIDSAAAAAAIDGKEDSATEKPPEDLELRERLNKITEAHGRDVARNEFTNAAKILRRLLECPGDTKLHKMRRDVLERTVSEDLFFVFTQAGFEERAPQDGAAAAFVWQNSDTVAMALKVVVHEVQRAADFCLDPDKVSFAEVSELVSNGRTLPGIEAVDDAVITPVVPKDSTMDRPKKPWEK